MLLGNSVPNWQQKLHLLTPVFQGCHHRVNFTSHFILNTKNHFLETSIDQEMTADKVPGLWM